MFTEPKLKCMKIKLHHLAPSMGQYLRYNLTESVLKMKYTKCYFCCHLLCNKSHVQIILKFSPKENNIEISNKKLQCDKLKVPVKL